MKLPQWEYMTALGYLLFGYDSVFGTTAAMMMNWLSGPLAVLALMVFAATFLGPGAGLLTGLLYYAMPMVGHFSFADMKIDNAVFAFMVTGAACGFGYLFQRDQDAETAEPDPRAPAPTGPWQWLFLSGLIFSLAFSIKLTAIILVMSLLAILVGTLLHRVAFFAGLAISLAAYTLYDLPLARISRRIGIDLTPEGVLLYAGAAAVAILGWCAWRRPRRLVPTLRAGVLFLSAFLLATLPWLVHNNIKAGHVMPRLEFNLKDTYKPLLDTSGTHRPQYEGQVVHRLPEALRIDAEHPACKRTANAQELDRYWGFRKGWGHYLGLPWRSVMNADTAGYFVTTTPLLLVFPLLALLPFFWAGRRSRWLRWLYAGTLYGVVQWIILANGVPWYGIGLLLGLLIAVEVLATRAEARANRLLMGVLIGLTLVTWTSLRLGQFQDQRGLLAYTVGRESAETTIERTIPLYDDIAAAVMQRHAGMPDRPYLYRVGTFIPYFIPRNLEVIPLQDQKLDFFFCLNQERDHALTLQRLQALGFNSMVFDLNTASLEKNPRGYLAPQDPVIHRFSQ